MAFDGGARNSPTQSAHACCVWSDSGTILWWAAYAARPGGTNNEMEAQALLMGLQWLTEHRRHIPIRIIGDSAIIVNMALSNYRVHALHLQPVIRCIRHLLFQLRRTTIQSVSRVFNKTADGLCNWIMDHEQFIGSSLYMSAHNTPWPLPQQISEDPVQSGCPAAPFPTQSDYDFARWRLCWRFVLADFSRVAHLVYNRFLNHGHIALLSTEQCLAPAVVATEARSEPSRFDTSVSRECCVNGIKRCVPLGVFRRLQKLAVQHHIPFPTNRLFLVPTSERLTIPEADVRLLTALIRLPHMGIEGVLRTFRGQTFHDQRPNKALRPHLYRKHLATYPDLQLLCRIAEHGVVPHWRSPSGRIGVRPVPQNYPSAEKGSAVVTHRLMSEYYRGRCIIANISTLAMEPAFHSSAFALVPKKDVPLSTDGRIIHDLSAPHGDSINDATNTDWTPDARWDPYSSIAQRVLDLRRRYPGRSIYALGVDIAEAFLHVPVNARAAPAFGGSFPRSNIGIVSGTAVFGWTASPGYFAVFGKAARHYQRTGASHVLGFPEPFWLFQWVDDIVAIEVDIGDRLLRAERRLRDAIKLVFGSDGWHEGKFTTWSQRIHAVGIDWNIPDLTVTLPQQKIDKVKRMVTETLEHSFVSKKRINSLVGVLRHVVTFIPTAKPFMQRLISVQHALNQSGNVGVPMTTKLRLDLEWWKQLVFENVFAGVPMSMFGAEPPEEDCWLIEHDSIGITIHGLTPIRTLRVARISMIAETSLAKAVLEFTESWVPADTPSLSWRHIRVHVQSTWEVRLLTTMYSKAPEGQQYLRTLALAQASRKIKITVTKVLGRTAGARRIDRITDATNKLKRAAINTSSLRTYSKKFRHWADFCEEFGFPLWIDELTQERQARIVGLFAGLCSLEGHNKRKQGNKYQTFDGKMAAVAFAHKSVRNARLNYKNPEFELIAQGYKRTNSHVDRKQPVTTPMLCEMHRSLQRQRSRENGEYHDMLWGSMVLAFFFLDRSSELWGPVSRDSSTGGTTHCIKAADVILRDQFGSVIEAGSEAAHSVEILFRSHKGDQVRQGNIIRHYRSGQSILCPVIAAETCLQVRKHWQRSGTRLGPYLTSVSQAETIKKTAVAKIIKQAAQTQGADPAEYSTHSMRIGGACALLAAGKSETVIRLMGRWSSWCFSVYTRLRPGMLREVSEHMIRASTWECPDYHQVRPQGGAQPSIAN